MAHNDPLRPALGWFLLLDGGLLALTAMVIMPSMAARIRRTTPLPADRVLRTVLLAAIITHLGEGIAAFAMAHRRGRDARAWAIQTTIVGFPSLRLLSASTAVGDE